MLPRAASFARIVGGVLGAGERCDPGGDSYVQRRRNDRGKDRRRAQGVQTDVADPNSVQALADRVQREFGHVNVLCNNAGVYIAGSLAEATREQWDWLMAVNLFGVIEGVRAFLQKRAPVFAASRET